ncbi:putative reverse transcriptase domain-containing protein [Tanacetum coccineum]|uniref:Reverse transcriptase domain-containing protein n=1 Tax=Tanacetum coccineum TaxID=301880 RepID=A0ABQ5I0E4_9ASTR
MAAPIIAISSDASEESVGSIVSRVILFGTIPTEILIVPDIPTDLPTAPELPAVSPFLCSDDSESDPESEPANELLERHVSVRPFSAMVSRWRAKVISHPPPPSGSSLPDTIIPFTEIVVALIPPAPSIEIATAPPACDTVTLIITASSAIRSRIRTTTRKSTLGLRPVMTPARSAALRRARQAELSFETSSSCTSSSSSSDLTSHTSESSFTASLQGIQISLEDHSHHSSEAARSPSRPLSRRRPQCSDYATSTSSSSARPSQKRSRSSTTSIPSIVHTAGALSPARADLLPPYKRYRDIEAETAAVATIAAVIVDGLGIEPDMAAVEMGFEPGLAVVESKSDPEEAEADDEADAKIQPEGTIEIGVDVTTRIDIPNDRPMPDTIVRLEQLKESFQDQQARNMIANGERSSLLEHVMALEGSNTRLRDALESEALEDGYFLDEESRIMTITCFGMTLEAIEELIYQRVVEALAAREANRNARLIVESQIQNGDDDDNGNRGNGNHSNNNRNGNRNGGNGGARRNAPVAKACTYKDFLNYQPHNFSGTEGVVGLARWFKKIESVFRISNCPPNSQVNFAACTLLDGALKWCNSHVQTIGIDEAYEMSWKDLMKLMIDVYCPRNEIKKLENELWNLFFKGTDVASYRRRF